MKSTPEILQLLKNFKMSAIQKYGIKSLGIFGSFARNQQDENSDLDVFVTLQENDFFTLERIREELEDMLPCHVDVICYRDSLRHSLKQNILRDAIYI